DPGVIEGREYGQLSLGAGEEHVQSAVTVGAIDWTEILVEDAVRRGTIDGRDENNVALVALHILKVLDEEILEITAPFLTIGLNVGIRGRSLVHQGLDEIALRLVHRDNADGTVDAGAHQICGLLDDRPRFIRIAALSHLVSTIDLAARYPKF